MKEFMAALGGFLKSLPEIIDFVKRLMGQWQEMRRQGVLDDIHSALDKAERAKTPLERSHAMLALVRAVSKPK